MRDHPSSGYIGDRIKRVHYVDVLSSPCDRNPLNLKKSTLKKRHRHTKRNVTRSHAPSHQSHLPQNQVRVTIDIYCVTYNANSLHCSSLAVMIIIPFTVVYFTFFRARKRNKLGKKEKTQEGKIL